MPTLDPSPRGHRPPRAQPLRLRAQLPAYAAPAPQAGGATHDFLVPNPRPDLTPPAASEPTSRRRA